MATCIPCSQGNCAQCEPVAHPDKEMVFTDCDHLCDPVVTTRDAQVTALIVAAQIAFGRGDDEATKTALRRCLAVMDGKVEAPARPPGRTDPVKPMRRMALVGSPRNCGRTTAEEYAAASGEAVPPEWGEEKR